MIAGAYENGYTDSSKAVTVTVTVEAPAEEEQPDDEPDTEEPDDDNTEPSVKDVVINFFRKVIRFIKMVLSWFGIQFNAI